MPVRPAGANPRPRIWESGSLGVCDPGGLGLCESEILGVWESGGLGVWESESLGVCEFESLKSVRALPARRRGGSWLRRLGLLSFAFEESI